MFQYMPEPLPAAETTYTSRLEFELDVYRICHENKIWLTTIVSTPDLVTLRCGLGVEAETPRALWCDCTISCTRRPGERVFTVVRRNPTHSCRLERDDDSRRRAIRWGSAKIKALEREQATFGLGSHHALEAQVHRKEDHDDKSDDEVSEQLTGSSARLRRTGPARSPGVEVEDAESGSEDECEVVIGRSMRRLIHPKLCGAFRREVEMLAEGEALELPSPVNGISYRDHTELRRHACAAAIQRGFSLVLDDHTPHISPDERSRRTAFGLRCHMANSARRNASFRAERCRVCFTIKLDRGCWRVVESRETHNHSLISFNGGLEITSTVTTGVASSRSPFFRRDVLSSSPKRLIDATPSSHNKRRRPSPPSELRLLPSISSPRTDQAPSPSAHPIKRPSPPLIPTRSAHRPSKLTPALSSFLSTLSSSSTLTSTAPLLAERGVDSVHKLVLLLSLSDEGLNGAMEQLEKTGVPKLAVLLLKKGVKQAREKVKGARPPQQE